MMHLRPKLIIPVQYSFEFTADGAREIILKIQVGMMLHIIIGFQENRALHIGFCFPFCYVTDPPYRFYDEL
ncbi:MAG: hypothetical protein BGO67_01545 [Alphaproteobacteria bacterium 41-28]|nr:MAG: hypothetical protein BGO67_01545 [Alphaproteobacteria bacterium 41-28]